MAREMTQAVYDSVRPVVYRYCSRCVSGLQLPREQKNDLTQSLTTDTILLMWNRYLNITTDEGFKDYVIRTLSLVTMQLRNCVSDVIHHGKYWYGGVGMRHQVEDRTQKRYTPVEEGRVTPSTDTVDEFVKTLTDDEREVLDYRMYGVPVSEKTHRKDTVSPRVTGLRAIARVTGFSEIKTREILRTLERKAVSDL